jgi:hypothetical protein
VSEIIRRRRIASARLSNPPLSRPRRFVRASGVDQMADQLAGETTDIDPLVDFLAAEVEMDAQFSTPCKPAAMPLFPFEEVPQRL